ncbi:hypothetical protein I7I53_10198 [Histoplasma capsulatum var. duboisii H88]|nr:hypothetical protein I7I53_10198 [Histoplasma capsulatum var. duboisii H88]
MKTWCSFQGCAASTAEQRPYQRRMRKRHFHTERDSTGRIEVETETVSILGTEYILLVASQ